MSPALLTQDEVDDARERGRQMAARRMTEDPEAKRRVEDWYGLEYCRRVYPEAYKSGFSRFVEKYLRW